jgi:hypothetical protein
MMRISVAGPFWLYTFPSQHCGQESPECSCRPGGGWPCLAEGAELANRAQILPSAAVFIEGRLSSLRCIRSGFATRPVTPSTPNFRGGTGTGGV